MQLRFLLCLPFVAAALSGCYKNTSEEPEPEPVVRYNLIETFEEGTKTAYAAANVKLPTGEWRFDDALIGSLAADAKNGSKSVRLRNGSLTMNFDVKNLVKLYISHAKYGNDANASFTIYFSTDKGQSFQQFAPAIPETSTTLKTDSFAITGSNDGVRFRIVKTGTARINIDDIRFSGVGDSGIVPGDDGGDTGPGQDTSKTGTPAPGRGTSKGPDANPVTGDNSNMLFGNPSGAQPALTMANNYLINQNYYVESYSNGRGAPNWVSWHLDETNTTNATDRLDNFAAFTGLPAGYYQVESNSYSNSGFDRGHNCPSADRTSSAEANSSTFLMTNMIPQAPQNNQQTWNNLEQYLRTQVNAGNEVYIVMGSYGTGGAGSKGTLQTLDGGRIIVPANVWKVAVILPKGNNDLGRVSAATRILAVNTPNQNNVDADWKKYIVTVREIETATGYNLLSALPETLQNQLRDKKDTGA